METSSHEPANKSSTEDRLYELETSIAYMQREMGQLKDANAKQAGVIKQLMTDCAKVSKRVQQWPYVTVTTK